MEKLIKNIIDAADHGCCTDLYVGNDFRELARLASKTGQLVVFNLFRDGYLASRKDIEAYMKKAGLKFRVKFIVTARDLTVKSRSLRQLPGLVYAN